jgi:hypothetical protein
LTEKIAEVKQNENKTVDAKVLILNISNETDLLIHSIESGTTKTDRKVGSETIVDFCVKISTTKLTTINSK